MKKVFLFFLIVFSVFSVDLNVFAERHTVGETFGGGSAEDTMDMWIGLDDEPDTEIADDGGYSSGVIGYYVNTNACNLHYYYVQGDHLYITMGDPDAVTSVYLHSSDKVTFVQHITYSYKKKGGDLLNTYTDTLYPNVDTFSIISSGFRPGEISGFYSTLPIFLQGDEESIKKYIEDGDTSGALNQEALNPDEDLDDDLNNFEVDDSVQLPLNFKVVSGYSYLLLNKILIQFDKDVIFTWNQTVDTRDYLYDVDVSFEFLGNDYGYYVGDSRVDKKVSDIEVKTPYLHYSVGVAYMGSKNMSVTLDSKKLTDMIKDYGRKNCYLDKDDSPIIRHLYIRVCNRVGNKRSNYVLADIDFAERKVTTSEVDENDYVVDDAEYDNDDGTVSKEDSENGTSSSNISINGIMKYIRSGFGLLGDGGVIALMSSAFSYLPSSIWVIIRFFLSMSVSIALIGVVKEMIF